MKYLIVSFLALTVACTASLEKYSLVEGLKDPMEVAIARDGQLYVVEREGRVLRINPQTGGIFELGNLHVQCVNASDPKSKYGREDGLLGIALDPNFSYNHRVFLYYSTRESSANRLSRFTLKAGRIDFSSEVKLLEIPTERENFASHQAGSLEFGPNGLLYLSTGDNTNPFASDGHAPIDNRDDRTNWDAQRSAGNTNDLRGKILRIRPTESGYEIPVGNLFKPGTAKTRPEIFVMGCRNPFRLSLNPRTSTLYWGEVGPDARKDTDKGPMGYDEVNQAKSAGNYGWPFVIANNKPFPIRDFSDNSIGAITKLTAPQNLGQRNTGLKTLPPAHSAFIWYPYSDSKEFPNMGKGGRNAMAGPICYHKPNRRYNIIDQNGDTTLLTYDWMRGKIFKANLDGDERLKDLEVLKEGLTHPIDLEMDRDGSLILLEYGSGWYLNTNGSISRLIPSGENKPPSITIKPLAEARKFCVEKVTDPENKQVTVKWYATSGVSEQKLGSGTTISLPPGEFTDVRAVATDDMGAKAFARIDLKGLNKKGNLALAIIKPQKAYGFGETVSFKISSSTPADPTKTRIRARYIPATGHDSDGVELPAAIDQIARANQCLACHQVETSSVGPSYLDVSIKYRSRKNTVGYLKKKLKSGGAGVWGEVPMPPQAALNDADADKIISAIIRLSKGISEKTGTLQGKIQLSSDVSSEPGGAWELTAESDGYSPAIIRIPAR